jgi:bifunctional non-homologous end joining protein LigD
MKASPTFNFFSITQEKNLEGVMAKRIDSSYFPGTRTTDWLKIKHHTTAEAIIAGYTAPSGARKFFGALILASKENNGFKYIGHTGTGFNYNLLKDLYDLLQPLVQNASPFKGKIKTNSPVTWVTLKLVCEVKYSEITADGKMRHPVFLRLRNDKKINEITMKKIKDITVPDSRSEKKESGDKGNKTFTFGKAKVEVTHLDKIYFPEDGITKGDVIDYYIAMSDYILPYLQGRPESLLRNPNGIHAKGFFHKDAAGNVPSFIKSKKVFSESTNKYIDYIICDNQATLTYLNNLGCIEINPWHSTTKALDNPDYLIIDIDPSDKNTFEQVIEAANVVKQIFDKAGAMSFCKTSGSTGLHVYVPTGKKYTYEQVKDFAYIICMMAHDQLKDFTTLERNLQKRGRKHIYMDYLQNRRGQTIASVYSLRPKIGATVSTPLEWKEVTKGLSPAQFTMHNIKQRVMEKGDIFKGIFGKGIDLAKCLANLEVK